MRYVVGSRVQVSQRPQVCARYSYPSDRLGGPLVNLSDSRRCR